ncbi:hypothetical protein AB0G85_36465 [Streptomyces sioyaensis]|uniref:hypothetical protein n=1 Tax=Streptomyces sioyaensis TaxID=67364 RepID=UPI003402F8F6
MLPVRGPAKITITHTNPAVTTGDDVLDRASASVADKRQGPRPEVGGLEVG